MHLHYYFLKKKIEKGGKTKAGEKVKFKEAKDKECRELNVCDIIHGLSKLRISRKYFLSRTLLMKKAQTLSCISNEILV